MNTNRTFVSKVWGWEDWIVNNDRYCGKILFIKKGHHTSFHYHKVKDETLYVQSGKLLVEHGMNNEFYLSTSIILYIQDSMHVPLALRHRLTALEDTYIIEFSTHHDEEDTVRLLPGE